MSTPQPLVNALKQACTERGLAFGDGQKPANVGTKPWVVVWPDSGVHTARSLGTVADDYSTVFVVHCNGLTPESARIAMNLFTGAVLGLRGQVLDGRAVHLPEQLSAQPLTRDDDADPPIYQQTAEWRIRTTPA